MKSNNKFYARMLAAAQPLRERPCQSEMDPEMNYRSGQLRLPSIQVVASGFHLGIEKPRSPLK
jgi:hypothetical protein